MKPDLDKIDDAVLALFYFASFTEGKGPLAVALAWKSHDWDALDRLTPCLFLVLLQNA
jgi:hypothetical protein